ncbi:MAG: hypothetical protein A2X46_05050 [Lentisphaerae bacterium GWF2_57_35]|nr:MAG: hypothetical protein A2X46_05050 [Lentisphaerae bacterium GWF2_57_35]
MKIAIFAYEDYDFLYGMLQRLVDGIHERGRDQVVGLLLFPNCLAGRKGLRIPLYYACLLGPFVFLKLVFRSVWNMIQRYGTCVLGRTRSVTYQGWCRTHDISCKSFSGPNRQEVVDWVKENDIDVVLIFIGQILKQPILAAPHKCVLNKHAAILPAFKGLLPVFWAQKEKMPVGVTIHKVVEEIDSGDILVQEDCPDRLSSVYAMYRHIFARAPALIQEALDVVAGERPVRKSANNTFPSSYYGLPSRRDYLAFLKAGGRFV